MSLRKSLKVSAALLMLVFVSVQPCFAGGGGKKWTYKYTLYNKTGQKMRINNAEVTIKDGGYSRRTLNCEGKVLKPGKRTTCKKTNLKGKFIESNFEVHFINKKGKRCDFEFRTEKKKKRESWTFKNNDC